MKQPVAMPWFLLSSALVIVSQTAISGMAASSPSLVAPLPGCPRKCGRVDIPFPFGIGAKCAWQGNGDFTITCNHTFSPPRPYTGNIEITKILLEKGQMHVYALVASVCYNSSSTIDFNQGIIGGSLVPPFLFSPTENVFTAIGCDTLAFLQGGSNWNFFTGCISYCASLNDSAPNGSACSGLGCCQTSIPANLSTIEIGWNTGNITINNSAWDYSPCKHAFVAEKHWYNFSRQHLEGTGNDSFGNRVGDRSTPLVLEWAIGGNGSCKVLPAGAGVPGRLTAPACVSAHSDCEDLNATLGGGYLCKCSKGYMGNPYIVDGCTDIHECDLRKSDPAFYEKRYPCAAPGSQCHDIEGGYECKCRWYQRGNGKTVSGCRAIFPGYAIAIVATFAAVVLACLAIALLVRRKQRKCFNENGGDILKGMGIKIFTQGDLKTITKTYSNLIGSGYFGKVYMGTIDIEGVQAQDVAVKCTVEKNVAHQRQKSLRREASQTEPESSSWKDGFVREIIFQFKIKHQNVVRLIGCCLETDVPILVFEYVSNGSLHDKLHGAADQKCTLSLLQRLDIAIGSAQALSHIHNHGEYNHVHGDVKPDNILLDSDLKAKVSDFGSSKLLSVNRYAEEVAVDGRYADPVYYKTGRFTTKSDVYSFGVVLLELITRKTVRYGTNCANILTVDFKKACKTHGNGRKMYDADIFSCNNEDAHCHRYTECLDMVGALAVRCLSEDVDERPTMAEVVEELEQVMSIACGVSSSEAT